jgi:hypothetical protein
MNNDNIFALAVHSQCTCCSGHCKFHSKMEIKALSPVPLLLNGIHKVGKNRGSLKLSELSKGPAGLEKHCCRNRESSIRTAE